MPVLTKHPSGAPSRARARTTAVLVAGGAAALAALGVSGTLDTPDHLDRITIHNPHRWSTAVAARPADRGGSWALLGAVQAGERTELHEVLDAGPRWEVRFRTAGEVEVTSVVERVRSADGWTIVVPDELAVAAGARGLPPSPPGT